MKALTKTETLKRRAIVNSKKNILKSKVDRERFYDTVERIYSLCDQIKAEIKDYKDEDIVFETR